jgi:putative transposase
MTWGRKRHVVVDTEGFLVRVHSHAADLNDRAGAEALVEEAVAACPTLAKVWADPGYNGGLGEWLKERCGVVLEIVAKLARQEGFVPLPRRWVVERTFANLGRNRRLSKDYEYWEDASESMVYLGSIKLILNRLTARCS